MDEWLIDIALGVACVAGAVFFVRYKLRARQDHHAAFRDLAQQLGLRFHATHLGQRAGQAPSAELVELQHSAVGRAGLKALAALPAASAFEIDGQLGALAVRIELRQRNNGMPSTVAQLRLPRALGLGLSMAAQSALDRAIDAVAADGTDITLGRPEFDRAVRVRASQPEAARRLLADSAVQRAAVALMHAQPTAWVDDEAVHLQLAGAVTDSTRWRAAFEPMGTLARALDAAAKSPLR